MQKIKIYDGCFSHAKSASAGGDNADIVPTYFEWCRDEDFESPVTFFTDTNLWRAEGHPAKTKVAWLIEPPSISDTHYKQAWDMRDVFNYILTFDTDYVKEGKNYLYYPQGGSWIKQEDWGMKEKTKEVSIIASAKRDAPGHKLRHKVIDLLAPKYNIDVYGHGYNPVDSKLEALSDYRYAIIIENCRMRSYFGEKLIDCMSVGTIPIYWGCPNINSFFDSRAILPFSRFCDLEEILSGVDLFFNRYGKNNIEASKSFRIVEDWLWNNYRFLFEESYV